MEYEHQLSNLIYDYLLNRFRFGYYQYGDSLPTVDVFCRLFNVSAHPIWTALRRLRADGYICLLYTSGYTDIPFIHACNGKYLCECLLF